LSKKTLPNTKKRGVERLKKKGALGADIGLILKRIISPPAISECPPSRF